MRICRDDVGEHEGQEPAGVDEGEQGGADGVQGIASAGRCSPFPNQCGDGDDGDVPAGEHQGVQKDVVQ